MHHGIFATPRKINMEHHHNEPLIQMTVLCKWVMVMSQPLILLFFLEVQNPNLASQRPQESLQAPRCTAKLWHKKKQQHIDTSRFRKKNTKRHRNQVQNYCTMLKDVERPEIHQQPENPTTLSE